MTQVTSTNEHLKAALPDTSGPVSLKGLGSQAEIFRDPYGIPHIQAGSALDAFYAQGYATSQDRLWHMDFDRHRAYGRWAELTGPSGLEQDKMLRRFGLKASALADYQVISDETRAMLDAYAAGVNGFIDTSRTLPAEYGLTNSSPEKWEPWDSLAIFKVRHILMGVFEAKLWRARLVKYLGAEKTAQLFPGYQPGQLQILPPGTVYSGPIEDALEELSLGAQAVNWLDETEGGSNNWVLSGSRTASGKPLLAGDPHRALEVPSVYYQNHLACPEFDVVGLSFPGVPGFPHFGHNASVAWCVTHTGADYQDLYVERFNQEDPILYDFKGEWKVADVHHETIAVKGERPVETDVTVTHHGPIVAGDPAKGYGVALCYTATSGAHNWADSLLNMLSAKNTDELEESMRAWVDPVNNFLYADIHGNIGYLTRGHLPVRSKANAWVPVPGWTGEHEWSGLVPFEEMPRSNNPGSGYITTANNRVTSEDYPHYVAFDYAPGFRAERVTHRLMNIQGKARPSDMVSIHGDRVSVPACGYLRVLKKVVPLDDLSDRARGLLLAWDGSMDRDSVPPTIYSALQNELVREVIGGIFGPLAHEALEEVDRGGSTHVSRLRARFSEMAEKDDRSLLPEGSEWKTLIATALSRAVNHLGRDLGQDMKSWTWGRVHTTQPHHTLSSAMPELAALLDPPSFPMGGDGDTPQAAGYSLAQPYGMTSTSVARYVFDLSDWNSSGWIVPLGSSGHPASRHYADQAPIWAEIQLIPMLYDWDRIAAAAESHQALNPDDRSA